jgi:hypothetical protein
MHAHTKPLNTLMCGKSGGFWFFRDSLDDAAKSDISDGTICLMHHLFGAEFLADVMKNNEKSPAPKPRAVEDTHYSAVRSSGVQRCLWLSPTHESRTACSVPAKFCED